VPPRVIVAHSPCGLTAVPELARYTGGTAGILTHRSDRLDQSGGYARLPGGSAPMLLSIDY
jgi:hypothetical protein